jgi:hypothetical protein
MSEWIEDNESFQDNIDAEGLSRGTRVPAEEGVRECTEHAPPAPSVAGIKIAPAHPSNRLVVQLSVDWRVVEDPLQWILQRKKGNPRAKNSGWQNRSFCRTRDGCCDVFASLVVRSTEML